MATTWKTIPGYEGWYEASDEGNIRVIRPPEGRGRRNPSYPHTLAPLWYRKGYYKVQFSSCGGTVAPTRQFIHRVIYRTFHGEIPDGLTVNHKDGSHDNNRADNLELATHLEQSRHARTLGLLKSRTATGIKTASLTKQDVLAIRQQLSETPRPTKRALADRYNVSPSLIRFIETRRAWKSL